MSSKSCTPSKLDAGVNAYDATAATTKFSTLLTKSKLRRRKATTATTKTTTIRTIATFNTLRICIVICCLLCSISMIFHMEKYAITAATTNNRGLMNVLLLSSSREEEDPEERSSTSKKTTTTTTTAPSILLPPSSLALSSQNNHTISTKAIKLQQHQQHPQHEHHQQQYKLLLQEELKHIEQINYQYLQSNPNQKKELYDLYNNVKLKTLLLQNNDNNNTYLELESYHVLDTLVFPNIIFPTIHNISTLQANDFIVATATATDSSDDNSRSSHTRVRAPSSPPHPPTTATTTETTTTKATCGVNKCFFHRITTTTSTENSAIQKTNKVTTTTVVQNDDEYGYLISVKQKCLLPVLQTYKLASDLRLLEKLQQQQQQIRQQQQDQSSITVAETSTSTQMSSIFPTTLMIEEMNEEKKDGNSRTTIDTKTTTTIKPYYEIHNLNEYYVMKLNDPDLLYDTNGYRRIDRNKVKVNFDETIPTRPVHPFVTVNDTICIETIPVIPTPNILFGCDEIKLYDFITNIKSFILDVNNNHNNTNATNDSDVGPDGAGADAASIGTTGGAAANTTNTNITMNDKIDSFISLFSNQILNFMNYIIDSSFNSITTTTNNNFIIVTDDAGNNNKQEMQRLKGLNKQIHCLAFDFQLLINSNGTNVYNLDLDRCFTRRAKYYKAANLAELQTCVNNVTNVVLPMLYEMKNTRKEAY